MARGLKSRLLLAALCCAWLGPRTAHAFEREWHVGGGLGVTSFAHDYKLGPALGLNAAYGISDMFDVRVELLGSTHVLSGVAPLGSGSARAEPLLVSAGISYKLDVLQWIPYGGVLVGYRHVAGALPLADPFGRDDVAASLLLGLDYSATRSFGLGVSWRGDSALSALSRTESMTLMLRAEYHWGF